MHKTGKILFQIGVNFKNNSNITPHSLVFREHWDK